MNFVTFEEVYVQQNVSHQILKFKHTLLSPSINVKEIYTVNHCHLTHFNEKTSFRQSLDKRVYVKISLDKKGYRV